MRSPVLILATALLAAATPAPADENAADVTVRFQEGLGGDLFTIENTGTCLATVRNVTIDLDGSVGALVFDTLPGGGGVNMPRPFRLREGAEKVTATRGGGDGDRVVTLETSGLMHGDVVSFEIDVDDSLRDGPWGRTRIAGPEFENARVTAVLSQPDGREWTAQGVFGPDGRAYVSRRSCAVS